MYMNSSLFEFNKMSTVASTILSSFAIAGITVNYLKCWEEPYHVTHMKNPFHKLVSETYSETRSKYPIYTKYKARKLKFPFNLCVPGVLSVKYRLQDKVWSLVYTTMSYNSGICFKQSRTVTEMKRIWIKKLGKLTSLNLQKLTFWFSQN